MYFHHIGYIVKDIAKSIVAFKQLGYEVEREAKFDDIRVAQLAFMKKDGQRVELIQPEGKESPIYGVLKHHKCGPYHLCFSTTSFEHDVAELERTGYMVIKETEVAPCMDNGNVIFLVNQDIGIIELYEKDSF